MENKEHYIVCPKFGGYRFAPACIVLDRYRGCRRVCRDLEKHLEKHEGLKEQAPSILEKRKPSLKQHTIFAGKDLPDSSLRCPFCDFQAKSERGLRCHKARSHKKRPTR